MRRCVEEWNRRSTPSRLSERGHRLDERLLTQAMLLRHRLIKGLLAQATLQLLGLRTRELFLK